MNLKTKFSLIIFSIVLIIVMGGFVIISITQKIMETSIGRDTSILTSNQMKIIDHALFNPKLTKPSLKQNFHQQEKLSASRSYRKSISSGYQTQHVRIRQSEIFWRTTSQSS
ncbi:MAG: hypothetical protein ACE5D7_11560 [Fidelibacterota bacterium]